MAFQSQNLGASIDVSVYIYVLCVFLSLSFSVSVCLYVFLRVCACALCSSVCVCVFLFITLSWFTVSVMNIPLFFLSLVCLVVKHLSYYLASSKQTFFSHHHTDTHLSVLCTVHVYL